MHNPALLLVAAYFPHDLVVILLGFVFNVMQGIFFLVLLLALPFWNGVNLGFVVRPWAG